MVMSVIDAKGRALSISEHLDLSLGVVEAVHALEFEYLDGVGIIDLPEHVFETYLRDELRHELPVVDTERLASDAEQKPGVIKRDRTPDPEQGIRLPGDAGLDALTGVTKSSVSGTTIRGWRPNNGGLHPLGATWSSCVLKHLSQRRTNALPFRRSGSSG